MCSDDEQTGKLSIMETPFRSGLHAFRSAETQLKRRHLSRRPWTNLGSSCQGLCSLPQSSYIVARYIDWLAIGPHSSSPRRKTLFHRLRRVQFSNSLCMSGTLLVDPHSLKTGI